MGLPDGNCPSEEFRKIEPIESFFELQFQIEQLFSIKITPNFPMNANMIILDEYKIKILERHLKREGYDLSKPCYILKTGWIVIPPSKYNERTLTHEELHAFSNLTSPKLTQSIYWKKDRPRRINTAFVEGITEFLTGCILYKFYPHCYEFFKSYYGGETLGYSYEEATKFWYTFVQVFGIEIVVNLYFNRNLQYESFEDLHNLVIEVIKNKYCNFELENSNFFDEWQSEISLVSKKFEMVNSKTDKILDFSVFPFLND